MAEVIATLIISILFQRFSAPLSTEHPLKRRGNNGATLRREGWDSVEPKSIVT
jgi:hypothetical protein